MANPWFRLYHEFADDPKVQMMSEPMQRRLVMLMCLRCKDETFDETLQAFQWRITPEEMAETKKQFLANGFIDQDWDLVNWNRRQYISDSSTERVRQYRERKKRRETLQKPTNNSDIDTDETGGNVTVTAPDTDTDTDTDAEPETEQKNQGGIEQPEDYAKRIMAEVKTLSPEALNDLAHDIACRHPRSRLRMWTRANVGQADLTAILDAMAEEAKNNQVTMAEAGRMMLGLLDAWDDVPREKWHRAPAIPKFYKQGDYRLPPNELPGIAPQEGAKHGKRNRSGNTDSNAEALRRLVEAARGSGDDPHGSAEDGGDRRDADGVGGESGAGCVEGDEALRGGFVGTDAGGVSSGVLPSNGGVQVLPKPSYPPRIQWPRRNG